jgi:flavodoxin
MMKFLKKISTILTLAAVAAVILAGCGTQSNGSSASSSSSSTKKSSSGSHKILVVYYSATGDTRRDAKEVAKATGGDLFEITPAKRYTQDDLDWTNDNSRVSQEYAHPSQRDVQLTTTKVPNWDDYDTVFIGYPIWWGTSAWPTNSFVKANDFSGKTVIPFCSSLSSGIGSSARDLHRLTNTGNWQSGHRFSSSASAKDVDNWVQSLGLAK